jgi:hypothetical protein
MLLLVVLSQPAASRDTDLVGIWIHYGDYYSPQLASPATSIDLFLSHENGTVYRTNTGPLGVTEMRIPPGIIEHCKAWIEGRLIAGWPCKIPIGRQALAIQTQSQPEGSPTSVVIIPASEAKDRYYVLNPSTGRYSPLSDDEVQSWEGEKKRHGAEFANQRNLKYMGASALMPVLRALPTHDISDIVSIHLFLSSEHEAITGESGEAGG